MTCLRCDRALKLNPNNKPSGEVDATVHDGTCIGSKANQTHRIHNPKEIFDSNYIKHNIVSQSSRYIHVPKYRLFLERYLSEFLPDIHQDYVCVSATIPIVLDLHHVHLVFL